METEGSLPHLQVTATCPYPEPHQSSPYPHIPLSEQFCFQLEYKIRILKSRITMRYWMGRLCWLNIVF